MPLRDLVFAPAPAGPYVYKSLRLMPLPPAPPPDPMQELADIADMLSAWLTDNTEAVFEDEPEIDEARNLILERIGR